MPCSGPRYLPRLDFALGLCGLFQRQIFGQRDHAEQLRPVLFQPRQIHLRQFDGRDLFRADQFGELRDGANARSSTELNFGGSTLLSFDLRLRGVEFFAWRRGVKSDRRLGVERHVDLAQCFVTVEVAVDAWQGHRLLRVGQFDSDQLLGRAKRLLRDFLRRLLRACCAFAIAAPPSPAAGSSLTNDRRLIFARFFFMGFLIGLIGPISPIGLIQVSSIFRLSNHRNSVCATGVQEWRGHN